MPPRLHMFASIQNQGRIGSLSPGTCCTGDQDHGAHLSNSTGCINAARLGAWLSAQQPEANKLNHCLSLQ